MSFASKYNKGAKFTYQIPDGSDHVFVKAKDLYEMDENKTGVQILSMYINSKGKYGDHPVLVADKPAILIDAPSHMTEAVREIMRDDEAVADINAGKVGVQAYKYETSAAACGYAFGLRWVDM